MATETTALDEFLSSINNEPVYEQQPLIADQTVVQEYVTPTTETPTLPRAGLETYQPQNIKDWWPVPNRPNQRHVRRAREQL